MIYRNTKTGAVVDSPCIISGGDWIEDEIEVGNTTLEDLQTDDTTYVDDNISDADDDIRLSEMTIAQMKALAAEREIDLGGATKRNDIIAVILAAEDSSEE